MTGRGDREEGGREEMNCPRNQPGGGGDRQADEIPLIELGTRPRRRKPGGTSQHIEPGQTERPANDKEEGGGQESRSRPGVEPYPQVNASRAGAIPKLITSAILSSSTPNSLVAPVSRAILPSSPSSRTA